MAFNVNIFYPARGPSATRKVQAADCKGTNAAPVSISAKQPHPLLFNERAVTGQCFHDTLYDLVGQGLQLLSRR